jgi:hypothetical protein
MHLMGNCQAQLDQLLVDHEGIARERCTAGLTSFHRRHVQSYPDEPDVVLLTDEEVRDYRVYLTGIKGYKAATVNAYQTPIRAIVRAQPGRLRSRARGVGHVGGAKPRLGDPAPLATSDASSVSPKRWPGDMPLIRHRPFRAPHHTISHTGL